MNNCREEFEEWMASEMSSVMFNGILDGLFDMTSLGFYKNNKLHNIWVSWKAGWERRRELSE